MFVSRTVKELFDSASTDVQWVPLGEYRLRDLAKPEEIFQASGCGNVGLLSAPRALTNTTTNLPVQVTTFSDASRNRRSSRSWSGVPGL